MNRKLPSLWSILIILTLSTGGWLGFFILTDWIYAAFFR